MEFTVRPVAEADWQEYRAHRLEMLRDTPIAFGERYEDARTASDDDWRERAARGNQDSSIRLVAIDASGRWIGSMGSYVEPDISGPLLVGVYVVPEHRGDVAGVTDALLDGVERWAAERSDVIHLEVHEDNLRARAAYAKRGWVETGHRRPYGLEPGGNELEMVKRLR